MKDSSSPNLFPANQPDKVVPFGKYRGQPIEVMAQDEEYVEWLTAQDWFRQRYSRLYTVIINNFQEPSHTPEHNALQVKFLDDAYCIAVGCLLYGAPEEREVVNDFIAQRIKQAISEPIERWPRDEHRYMTYEGILHHLELQYRPPTIRRKRFEGDHGIDVAFEFYSGYSLSVEWSPEDKYKPEVKAGYSIQNAVNKKFSVYADVRIEIKPAVSDDFPAVLRQMKRSEAEVLFISEYTGVGATQDQFIELFKTQGIRVVFDHQISLS